MRRAESDEGRDVEIAHADDVESRQVGLEPKLARPGIVELALDLDPRAPHHGHDLIQDTPLGQRQDQRFVTQHRTLPKQMRTQPASSTGWLGRKRVGQGSPKSSKWHRMRPDSSRMLPPPAKSRKIAPAPALTASSTSSRSVSPGWKPRRRPVVTPSMRKPVITRSRPWRGAAGAGPGRGA